jgi:Kef-type K+ transport system membrane component KefB
MASTRSSSWQSPAFCRLALGWHLHAAEIGGVALSTTSVAVVYAVMVETGLNRHDLGKLILAACFLTDLGTVLALGGLFASYGWLLIAFIAVSAVTVAVLPRLVRLAIKYFWHRVSEPEIKLLLVVLLGLGGLATQAGSEAVLPAYVAGLVVAGVFLHDRVLMDRLRSIAFALLTPFFFLRAGTLISAPRLSPGPGSSRSCCWSSSSPSWRASGRSAGCSGSPRASAPTPRC